jgi:cytochrome c
VHALEMTDRIAFRRLMPVTASLLLHVGIVGAIVLGPGWMPVRMPTLIAELVEPEPPPVPKPAVRNRRPVTPPKPIATPMPAETLAPARPEPPAPRPVVPEPALALAPPVAGVGAPAPPRRLELAHPPGGHEVRVSAPALAVDAGGRPIVAWSTAGHAGNTVLVARPGDGSQPVRVNPAGTSVDARHQAPGLAVGPGGEVYVTWSAAKPRPEGVLFASDLYLSRSLDGGRTFEPPLRVNDDRPISHSFEDLAVAPDGTVLIGWIDSRDGQRRTATYVARVADHGARLERVTRLEGGETCVCCRVSVGAGPGEAAAVLWRKVFPGDIRDMVLSRSSDGGRTFDAATTVHADRWAITACPHRGGQVAADASGRLYAVWYNRGHGRPARRALGCRARRPALRRAAARAHGDRLGARPRTAGRRRVRPRDRGLGGFHRGPPPDLVTLHRGGWPEPRPCPHALAGDQGLGSRRRRRPGGVPGCLARGAIPGNEDDRGAGHRRGGWSMTRRQFRVSALGILTLVGVALFAGARVTAALAQPRQDHGAAGGSPTPAKPAESGKRGVRISMDELHRAGGVPPGWRFAWPDGDAKKGREAFAKLECYQCHEVTGESFPPLTPDPARRGPALSGVGTLHPAEYFAESILDPNAVIVTGPGHTGPDGLSIMPDFRDSLTLAETIDLVAYIRSLTGNGHEHAAAPAAREQVVGVYRVRLDYAAPGAAHGHEQAQGQGGHQHPGGGGAASAAPAHLMVFVSDTTLGEPVPYLPITATIHADKAAPRMLRLAPMLGGQGFHYGADVTLPAATKKITIVIGKPTVRLMPAAAGRLGRGAEVSFEWGK